MILQVVNEHLIKARIHGTYGAADMNLHEEDAYKDLMRYHKTNSKVRLQLKLAKLWLLHGIAAKTPMPGMIASLHRMRGVKVGRDVFIGNDVHLDLLHPDLITIEDHASIGMRTMVFAHASHWSPFLKKTYPRKTAPVIIGKGSWIAPGCILLPGVHIGENSVVGSGSVVLEDVEPYTLVAGNPAKFIKRLEMNNK
jgi:acetyltransferase-like isoleucine patch superfamily enzyme